MPIPCPRGACAGLKAVWRITRIVLPDRHRYAHHKQDSGDQGFNTALTSVFTAHRVISFPSFGSI